MRPRDIIEAALQKQKTPRTPCFPLIDIAFAAAFAGQPMRTCQLQPTVHAASLNRCLAELPVDGLYINLCLEERQARQSADGLWRVDAALDLAIPENDVLSIAHSEITALDDQRLETAELFHPGILATFRHIDPRLLESRAVVAGLTGTFSQVAFLYGVAPLLTALLDQPEAVRRALERRHEVALRQARQLCGAGARHVWIGEGLGSGSLISPAHYREFVLPYEQDLARELRQAGALSILHICGDVRAALPDIAACGADGFDLDYPVDLSDGLNALLPRVAVKGNINPSLFLPGRSAQLRQACRAAAQAAAGRSGYIMSTGCLVPRDSAASSFQIMAEACDVQEGRYKE